MLEIHPSLLLYQGVIFVIFAFLMWKFVYKNLVKLIEDRRRRIEETLLEAEKRRGEAEALRQGYESRVSELAAQADETMRAAAARGKQRYDELIEAARVEAERIMAARRREAELEIEQAKLAARAELAGIATELARKALARSITPEVDEQLIRTVNQELAAQQWKR